MVDKAWLDQALGGTEWGFKEPVNNRALADRLKGRTDNVLIRRVVQKGNEFAFLVEYAGTNFAEAYMSLLCVDKKPEDIDPVLTLAKSFADCDEEEKLLWLRIASPICDSSIRLEQAGVKNTIATGELERNKLKILEDAFERRVMYHVFCSYTDGRQTENDITLRGF